MRIFEGARISSFIKGTNQIWEGIVLKRDDGTPVAYNEDKRQWMRVSLLENIKILNEDFTSQGSPPPETSKDITYDELRKNFVRNIVGEDPKKAVTNAEKVSDNKSAVTIGGASLLKQAQLNVEDKDLIPKNADEAASDFSSDLKDIAAKAKAADTNNPEDGVAQVKKMTGIKEQLHPKLQKFYEDTELDNFADYLRDAHEDGKINKESYKVIDEYLSNPLFHQPEDGTVWNETSIEILGLITKMLHDGEDNIKDRIKSLYEMSDTDAEEYIIKAMEVFVENSEVEPKQAIQDITSKEVEQSFKDTIDQFEGDETQILDHLQDVYEIPMDKAEQILEANKGYLIETIIGFRDFVYQRALNELKDNK